MEIKFVSDDISVLGGQLQDDSITFSINNSYTAPFEATVPKIGEKVLEVTTGGLAKFEWMFYQYWDNASPPEVTFKVAFIAESAGDNISEEVLKLFGMYGVDINDLGQLQPPGGFPPGALFKLARNWLTSGTLETERPAEVTERKRLVDIYLGGKLCFSKLLPERFEFVGKLPFMKDNNFGVIVCSCTFKARTLLSSKAPFLIV